MTQISQMEGGRAVVWAKRAVITGAGRGIGRACALGLARAGWGCVLVARSRGELEETAEMVGRIAGGGCEIVVGDVRDSGVVREACSGEVGCLVYCAGVAPLMPVEATSEGVWREVLDVNLSGAFAFARGVWGSMVRAGAGRLVFISSMASRDPFVGFSAYAAAKAGVEGMVRALDREGKPHGVRAFAVAPGAVETLMFRKLATTEQFPTEQALSPEDVAEAVMACVSGGLAYSGGETIYLSRT